MYYSISDISNCFSVGSWGNAVDHIEPTEPCIYVKGSSLQDELIKLL